MLFHVKLMENVFDFSLWRKFTLKTKEEYNNYNQTKTLLDIKLDILKWLSILF
jgi:hypothetical protein